MRLTGQIISRYLTDGDIVLVSSDFTHYGPRYDFVPFLEDAPKHVRELDEGAFEQLQKCDLKGFIDFRERTHDTICGFYPCTVLLSMLPPETHATLLSYQTSRDVAGAPDNNSVSYLAVVFSNKQNESDFWHALKAEQHGVDNLTDDEKSALLKLARKALVDYVRHGKTSDPSDVIRGFPVLDQPAGAFVTLYKRQVESLPKAHKELRGCIGYIWPVRSLAQAVVDNAIGASSKDPRFTPVTVDELDGLQIDINVLTPPRPIGSCEEIELGRDGVIMYKGGKQSVFLPSVATEFGWTLEEMLTQLSMKAGCPKDGWQSGARFDVFQADSFLED
jgi:AmmeMemoRadiSam system protein A